MAKFRELKGLSYIDFPSEYCLVDIETTGLVADCDEIIEIGAVKYTNGEIVAQFQTLVQPSGRGGVFVDSFITGLTGITNEMLIDAPKPREAVKSFSDFLGDSIIVGYNVSFDVNFLYDCYMKHLKRPLTNNFIDVLRIARRLCADLPSREIDCVLSHFGIIAENRHRAIGDCIATQLIYERLQAEALRDFATLQDFSSTFKVCEPKKQKPITDKKLEDWKIQLYDCNTVKQAFNVMRDRKFSDQRLRAFAEYLGVKLRKYADRDEIITALVYSMIDEKLKYYTGERK